MPSPSTEVYATVEALKAQIEKAQPNHDTTLTNLIKAASRAIDGFCNRIDGFKAMDSETRLFQGQGSHVWVGDMAVVTSVETRSGYSDTYSVLDASRWMPFAGSPDEAFFNQIPYVGILAVDGNLSFKSARHPTVRIVGQWGYSLDVPPVIEQACIAQAARWYKRGLSAWADAVSNGEQGQLYYRKSLDPDIQMMLELGRMINQNAG